MARPAGRRRLLLGAVAVAALLALSGCSYQPPEVCGPCQTDELAQARGYNVSATSEVLTIDVRADGSARWTARLELTGPGTTTLRENATLTRSLVRSAIEGGVSSAAPANPRNLAVRFEGRTLVVEFDDANLARGGPGGVTIVERFHDEESGVYGGYVVRADRVVLRAPDGAVVANRPPNGERRRSAVVWREYVDERTYVVFAPDRSGASTLLAELAVFGAVAGWVTVPTLAGAIPAALVLVAIGLVLVDRHRGERPWRAELRSGWMPAVAVLAGAVLVAVALPGWTAGESPEGVVGWALLSGPAVAFAALGRYAQRGPRVRTGCLAALAGFPLPVALGVVLEFGSASIIPLVWALLAALVGLGLYLLGRWVATAYATEG